MLRSCGPEPGNSRGYCGNIVAGVGISSNVAGILSDAATSSFHSVGAAGHLACLGCMGVDLGMPFFDLGSYTPIFPCEFFFEHRKLTQGMAVSKLVDVVSPLHRPDLFQMGSLKRKHNL